MDKAQDSIRSLTNKELKKLQGENPEVAILPGSEDNLAEEKEIFKQRKQAKNKYPILKETAESLNLSRLKMNFERAKNEYLETIATTSLRAMLTRWLNENTSLSQNNYANYITDLLCKGIFPEFDSSGNPYTVADLIANYDFIIRSIQNIEKLSRPKIQERIECIKAFLRYLEKISTGKFRVNKRLWIPYPWINNQKVATWWHLSLNDFDIAQDQIKAHPLSYPDAMYHLQQAAEKGFKAFLILHDIDVENTKKFKIHDLNDLLKECIKLDETFETLSSLKSVLNKLSPYAKDKRYQTLDSIKTDVLDGHMKAIYSLLIYIQEKIKKQMAN